MAKYKVKTKDYQLIVKAKLIFKEKLNERQLEFFSSKKIRGMLKAKRIKKGTIEYSGPVGICLHERLQKEISKYDFFFIMEQIVDIVQRLNANSLILNNVIFDIKYVFINETTKEVQFIYLPLEQVQPAADIMGFMESIIYSARPTQEEDMEYISRFVYFIKGLENFDTKEIEKYIQAEDRGVVNTIKRHNVGQRSFTPDRPAGYDMHHEEDPEATGRLEDEEATELLGEDEETGLLGENEETGLLGEDEETGLLGDGGSQSQYTALYRITTNEAIMINKPVFRIGKERSYSDYIVSDNDKISKRHANVISRGQRLFVMDLDSMNRTYVNGKVIPVQQEVEICDGDCLRLANEEFEVRIGTSEAQSC